MRRRAKLAKAKAEARLPVAPKSRKNGAPTVRDLEKRLAEALKREAEALEQQTATSEILQVISGSPTEVEPVFEGIARSATTLCEADLSGLYTFDGELIHVGALYGRTPDERLGDIVADERKVKQILLNLLSNAVKFTPEGAGSASPPRRPMAS